MVNVDTAPARGPAGGVHPRRPHRPRRGDRGADRHRRPVRRRRRGGAPRGDPRTGPAHQRRDVRQQRAQHPPRVLRGPARGHPERRLGVQRDRARPAVRDAPAVRPGRRGVRRPAGEHLLARQGRRGGDGPALRALGPVRQADRPAVLQRDGRRGLRGSSRRSSTTRAAGSGTCGATSTRATAPWRCSARSSATSPGSRRSSSRPRTRSWRPPSADLLAALLPGRAPQASGRAAPRRSCRSTRPAACWATTRGTPGATTSERRAAGSAHGSRAARGRGL